MTYIFNCFCTAHYFAYNDIILRKFTMILLRCNGASRSFSVYFWLAGNINQQHILFQIDDSSLTGTQGIQTVDVKLTKEKLNAMLDGLGKIRDQLTSVSQR